MYNILHEKTFFYINFFNDFELRPNEYQRSICR